MSQEKNANKRQSRYQKDDLLKLEEKYCSWGDTVHYAEKPNIFTRAEGSYLYDRDGVEYLDLQMWYSAVNFGYGNRRLNNALIRQIDTLPQLASRISPCRENRARHKTCTEN